MSFSKWQKLSDRMIAKVVLLAWLEERAGGVALWAVSAAIVLSVIGRSIRAAANSGHRPRANLICSFSSPPIGGEEYERSGTAHSVWRCFADPMASASTLSDVPARLDRLPWSGFHKLVAT